MNDMIVRAEAVAIGNNACAGPAEIALASGGKQITIDKQGMRFNGEPVAGSEAMLQALREVFANPGDFLLDTGECSFRIQPDGKVHVNGVLVGEDPEMLGRAMGFFMRVMAGCLHPDRVIDNLEGKAGAGP
jgi:hypothetical protein